MITKKKMKLEHRNILTDLYDTSYIYELDSKRKILECCGETIAYCTPLKAYILPKHPTDFEIEVIREFLRQNNFEVFERVRDLKSKYLWIGKRPRMKQVVNLLKEDMDKAV